MTFTESKCGRAAERTGTCMFVSGVLIIGPVGFALLCGLAYAMHSSNLALGAICGLLLSSPAIFLAVWVPFAGASLRRERSVLHDTLAEGTRLPETEEFARRVAAQIGQEDALVRDWMVYTEVSSPLGKMPVPNLKARRGEPWQEQPCNC